MELTKGNQIFQELVEKTKLFNPGERFYSVRKMMQKYSVSQRTVEQALAKLESEGYIMRKPGLGLFVKGTTSKQLKHIVYLTPDSPSSVFQELEQVFTEEFTKTERYTLSRSSFTRRQTVFQTLPAEADGIIISPPFDPLTINDIISVKSTPAPVIFLGKNLADVCLNSVSTLPESVGSLAAAHLINKGHKKLAVLISEPKSDEVFQRVWGFTNFAKLSGCDVVEIDCDVQYNEDSPDKAYEILKYHILKEGINFSAIFVISDCTALGAIKAFKDMGIEVPEQVSVIGCDGLSQGKYYQPPLTTVRINFRTLAKQLVKGLDDIFSEKKKFFTVRNAPELLERESVKNI